MDGSEMLNINRLIVATIMGVVSGLICFGFASSGSAELPAAVAWQIIISRTLIGFAIGISIFKMGHWTVHGAVIGLLFSIPLAVSGFMAPDNPEFSKSSMFIAAMVMGVVYGLLIEFVTTVLFKAKMPVRIKMS
jgi:D-alanyl-lipoteichoic acid acyltransferase DltB (MBOAT superfamily)